MQLSMIGLMNRVKFTVGLRTLLINASALSLIIHIHHLLTTAVGKGGHNEMERMVRKLEHDITENKNSLLRYGLESKGR